MGAHQYSKLTCKIIMLKSPHTPPNQCQCVHSPVCMKPKLGLPTPRAVLLLTAFRLQEAILLDTCRTPLQPEPARFFKLLQERRTRTNHPKHLCHMCITRSKTGDQETKSLPVGEPGRMPRTCTHPSPFSLSSLNLSL